MRSVLLCLTLAMLMAGATVRPLMPVAVETYMLPMRDGVRLATDVYLPRSAPPYPVILIRTPYDKNALKPIGEDGAQRGYAVVVQDTRGRFASEGALRMRYRESRSRERLMQAGQVYRVEVDLWTTAMVFNTGHRLRVHVTSSSAPGYDPNPNTGEPFRASIRTRPARNTIYCDAQRPSHIVLPVVKR